MKRISRILVAIDGSARSYAALVYLGKLFSKQVEIVLFHIMAEAPESLRDLSPDPSYEKESIEAPCGLLVRRLTMIFSHLVAKIFFTSRAGGS